MIESSFIGASFSKFARQYSLVITNVYHLPDYYSAENPLTVLVMTGLSAINGIWRINPIHYDTLWYIMVDVSLDFSKKQMHKSCATVISNRGKGLQGKISPLVISAH